MRVIFAALAGCFLLFNSCQGGKNSPRQASAAAQPIAILKAGSYPLWFQFGPQGPLLLNSIDEARYSRALIPWPLAPHVRFIIAHNDDIYFAVNRDGFLAFSPRNALPEEADAGIAMYRFPGGTSWETNTIAAFVLHNGAPLALLYRDDHFLDIDAPLPFPRTWTFSLKASEPAAFDIPAFADFSASEGWDIDALRCAADGAWYFRAVRKDRADNKILFMRSSGLDLEGEAISAGIFYNSALPEPLSAAPPPVRSLLAAADARGAVMAVSPDFCTQRYFAHNADSAVDTFAYARSSSRTALVINSGGHGCLTGPAAYSGGAPDNAAREFIPLELPELPENFVYTGIALAGDTIVAVWEEQEEYSIGAAGFMALRLPYEKHSLGEN